MTNYEAIYEAAYDAEYILEEIREPHEDAYKAGLAAVVAAAKAEALEEAATVAAIRPEDRLVNEPGYYVAGRDEGGGIRLSGGRGLLVATPTDTRADVQGWFDNNGGLKWAAMYRAALDLMDSEATK